MPDNKHRQLISCFILMSFAAAVCITVLADIYFGVASAIIRRLYWIPVLGCWIYLFAFKRKELTWGSIALLALPLWYAVCCLGNGIDVFLDPASRTEMLLLAAFTGIVFPISILTDDINSRTVLHFFLITAMTVFSILLWIGFIGIINHKTYDLFGGLVKIGAQYDIYGGLDFVLFRAHRYRIGIIAVSFFLAAIYVTVYYGKKFVIPGIFFITTFFFGTLVTNGRTTVLMAFTGLAYIVCAYIIHLRLKPLKTALFIVLALALSIALMFGTVEFMYRLITNSSREVASRLYDFSGRLPIWKALFPAFTEKPIRFIFGLPLRNMMDAVNTYLEQPQPHMHSSYFQTMAVTGVPGALLMIYFIYSLIFSAWKLVFPGKGKQTSLSDKLLFAVPLSLLIGGFLEVTFLVNGAEGEMMNIMFMIFSGYTIFTANKKC